uniref:Uncharacterized protein n=1 Tax=Malurus cyaneus samueli TaxID=2593467 RepID=A0A8C5TIM2_9PASS
PVLVTYTIRNGGLIFAAVAFVRALISFKCLVCWTPRSVPALLGPPVPGGEAQAAHSFRVGTAAPGGAGNFHPRNVPAERSWRETT